MTWDVALILGIDGLANGAVYLLAGLGLVLIFSVTRVVFVPFGDIAAFAALTLAAFETGRVPPTIGMVMVLAALAATTEVASLVRRGERRQIPKALLTWGVLPLLPCALAWLASSPGEVPPAGPGPWAFASYRQTYPLAVFVVWPDPMARSDESADRCTDHTESSAHVK